MTATASPGATSRLTSVHGGLAVAVVALGHVAELHESVHARHGRRGGRPPASAAGCNSGYRIGGRAPSSLRCSGFAYAATALHRPGDNGQVSGATMATAGLAASAGRRLSSRGRSAAWPRPDAARRRVRGGDRAAVGRGLAWSRCMPRVASLPRPRPVSAQPCRRPGARPQRALAAARPDRRAARPAGAAPAAPLARVLRVLLGAMRATSEYATTSPSWRSIFAAYSAVVHSRFRGAALLALGGPAAVVATRGVPRTSAAAACPRGSPALAGARCLTVARRAT